MEYDEQRQREVVAPAAKRAPEPPHPLLALQQGVGNAAVSRAILARNRNMIQQQYDDARKERETFVAAGKKGPQTYNPSTNNAANYYGGFDVEYEPTKGELNVKLKGAVGVPGRHDAQRRGPRAGRRAVRADRRRRGRDQPAAEGRAGGRGRQVDVVEQRRAGRLGRDRPAHRLQELGRGHLAREAPVPLHEELLGGPRRDHEDQRGGGQGRQRRGQGGRPAHAGQHLQGRQGLRRRQRRRQPHRRRGRHAVRQHHEHHVRGRGPAQGRAAGEQGRPSSRARACSRRARSAPSGGSRRRCPTRRPAPRSRPRT